MTETTDNSITSDVDQSEETCQNADEIAAEVSVDARSLLSTEQVQQLKDIFNDLDQQGNGKISTKLIGLVIRNLGHNPTKSQIRKYMSQADPEGKGWMDFQGFLLPIAKIIDSVPESLEDIILAFKTLDENDSGFLESSQLQEYLTTLGETLEDFEIDLLIKMADPKATGKIMYKEFLEKIIGVPIKKQMKKDKKK